MMSKLAHKSRALVRSLLRWAYPDLRSWNIEVGTGTISALAEIYWSSTGTAKIILSKVVAGWPEPALIGLISHEISHISTRGEHPAELNADTDATQRGLGVYVAFERAFIGRFQDQHIRGKQDRYLGYVSLRKRLSAAELVALDQLLGDHSLVPGRRAAISVPHDIAVSRSAGRASVLMGGRHIDLGQVPESSDIKIVTRNGLTQVLVDEVVVTTLYEPS
ncbi:MAG: hypothetical protein ACP6IT_06990 [Candidatus Thorarchaeota archaeon]